MLEYEFDEDTGLVEFYIDGKEICCWNCESKQHLELNIRDARKIFEAGKEQAIKELEEDLKKLDKDARRLGEVLLKVVDNAIKRASESQNKV